MTVYRPYAGWGAGSFQMVCFVRLRPSSCGARELARVCSPKVTQPSAADGDDNALARSAVAAGTLRPGWVRFAERNVESGASG